MAEKLDATGSPSGPPGPPRRLTVVHRRRPAEHGNHGAARTAGERSIRSAFALFTSASSCKSCASTRSLMLEPAGHLRRAEKPPGLRRVRSFHGPALPAPPRSSSSCIRARSKLRIWPRSTRSCSATRRFPPPPRRPGPGPVAPARASSRSLRWSSISSSSSPTTASNGSFMAVPGGGAEDGPGDGVLREVVAALEDGLPQGLQPQLPAVHGPARVQSCPAPAGPPRGGAGRPPADP
jgi:hypothetical protein